ncbi:MAG TPA: prepilin-type N-terminal cleavage/methylation domain-containing protein [Candidatus Limnocylindria bacterium]|nr:prepilin-type N-terminal cleavage/methylation domain-containing protein [Candidatus Limnocylindria bacterium]
MRKRNASAKGFTLLEVLVSLAILSATLITAYQVTSGALAAEQRAGAWTTAILLGEEKLQEVTETFPEVQETNGTFPDPHTEYAWRLIVKQALHPDAREVYLTVSWETGGDGETIMLSGLSVR